MKNLLYALLASFLIQQATYAQPADTRTATTKIADLLALQPAETTERFRDAMGQLERFSATDIAALLGGLVPPDQGNNAGIAYASNSYSYHVMLPGNQAQRAVFVQGAVIALGNVKDSHNKGYIIQLLQNAGDDSAVEAVAAYLHDGALSEKAARALARIGTDKAGQALLSALGAANGAVGVNLVNALGFMSYAPANGAILAKSTAQDADLRKATWYALSQIADPSAVSVLASAAASAGYGYEPTEATAAFLNLGYALAAKGDVGGARRVANTVFKQAGKAGQVASRVAALGLLTELDGARQTNALLKGAKSADPIYRATSLQLLTPYLNDGLSAKLLKQAAKGGGEVSADALRYLADQGQAATLPVARQLLANGTPPQRLAAVYALRKVGGDVAIGDLLGAMTTADGQTRDAIRDALLLLEGNQVVPAANAALNATTSPAEQALLIDVLAQRGAGESVPTILGIIKGSGSADAKQAAYTALPQVVRPDDLDAILDLLTVSAPDRVPVIQKAAVTAILHGGDTGPQVRRVVTRMQAASAGRRTDFFPILSGVGGIDGLKAVAGYVDNADATLRNAAIAALSQWSDVHALSELVALSRQPVSDAGQFDSIIKGLVRLVVQSTLPDDQKLLHLRDAFVVVKTADHQRLILRAMAQTKTYPALLFAGRFLDDDELKGTAANTVMEIALDQKGLYGDKVNELLNKVVGLLSGSESNYLREAVQRHLDELPKGPGYVPLFNGQDLSGWKGLVANPIKRAEMDAKTLNAEQIKADEAMRKGWYVAGGELHFNGHGDNIATVKQYGDFELLVDWKLAKEGKDGDAGIYLRGTPQVQIWDTSRVEVGAQVGSGGLYNNQKHESKPLKVADNALGEWNTFRITMIGDRVTVYLNGELVTDNVVLENYWDRGLPIFPVEQIELQAHGTHVSYRDIYIRELPRKEVFALPAAERAEGFEVLFDGTNLDSWTGNTNDYVVTDEGTLAIFPSEGSGGNFYTKETYDDFIYRFAFRLTPGANNGVGIRAPMEGDAAYAGIEIQVLDDGAEMYKDLAPYQYHGSVYGIIAAKRGALKPLGEWNEQEIRINGDDIKVTLNGKVIVDGNLKEASENGTLDKKDHPGLQRKSGHIAFLGHGSEVHFKDIRIKRL